jgi:hypothetical protein
MRRARALIALLSAACTTGLLSCSPPLAGTETGNGTAGIVMGQSGKPAAGTRVTLVPVDFNALAPAPESNPICSTETDAAGRYCFYDLEQGYYNLFCDSGSTCAYLDSLRIDDESADTMPTAFLRKSGSVAGSAFISSGRSASSGFVAIIGSRRLARVSPHDGSFNLSGLAPGKYRAEVVTQENGYFRQRVMLRIREGQADTIRNPFLFVSATVTALASDSQGVWIGTINGLANMHKEMWRAYGMPDGLSSSRINCLCGGGAEAVWAGTSLRLARIRNDTLTEGVLPSVMLALTNITALERDISGNLWIGTPQGLFFYNGTDITPMTGNDALTGLESTLPRNKLTAVSGILCRGREVIAGTLHGAYVRDSAKTWHEIQDMTALAVSSITPGSGAVVWFGTNQGVRSWDRISGAVTAPFDDQVTGAVTSLAEGQNDSLYIGTAGGLFVGRDSLFMRIDLGDAAISVNALSRDGEGALWVGTNDGIIRVGRDGIRAIR